MIMGTKSSHLKLMVDVIGILLSVMIALEEVILHNPRP
jgi:hypothetical protein